MTIGRTLGRSFAVSAALGRVPDPVLNAYGSGARAIGRALDIGRSARWLATGSQMTRMASGRAAGPKTVVAGEFWHGPGDREAAIRSLSADFDTFAQDVTIHATKPVDAEWALAEVVPAVAEWKGFVAAERESTLAPFLTDWETFEDWQERLVRLRELARARGIILISPKPIPLPHTIWERSDKGIGSSADRWLTLGRWLVYAALGIMGLASLYSALRTVKHDVELSAGGHS